MDIATLLGLIGAMVVVGVTVALSGSPVMFINPSAIVIVVIGTLMVTLAQFSLRQFLSATKIAAQAFALRRESPEELIQKSVELAGIARKGGILALEQAEIPNEFMQKGLNLVIDGHDPVVVRDILHKDITLTVQRHMEGRNIWMAIGDVAPAMGMIGTLIGLVAMLATMDDPAKIAPAMAVALITTLYGAILSNMVAQPIANKLELRSKEEKSSKLLITDAIVGIQDSQNPRVLESLLSNYLPPSKRENRDEQAAA